MFASRVVIAGMLAMITGHISFFREESKTAMTPAAKITLSNPIYVAGYQVRTNNAREMSGQGEIGKLWGRFMQQNLAAHIPNRVGQTLIVVYSDYASDEKGDYSYLLGAPVSSVDAPPAGLTYRHIQPGTYAVIEMDKGDVTQIVPGAWRRIWAMTPEELGGRRAFTEDYEVYDQRSADPKNARVEIHLALRSANSD
ncbi:GyrI-like domain-containing protein [Acidicapsa dinghuensis]|uniref:GyrI-like domain-containing protein n=1 Tax=Acidicapsa dinghuensis TaxID=2218256 RepID=A0ABW1EKE8_9BACT|nr:GyrI-like domain-containing protein [Acidicapsa dinghuensis]